MHCRLSTVSASKCLFVVMGVCGNRGHCQSVPDGKEVSPPQHRGPSGMLIVKYGGSAITNKQSFECLDNLSLAAAAQQLKAVHSGKCWSKIVLVHGAGSFGHFHAKNYGLKSGGSAALSTDLNALGPWYSGLVLTRQSVLKLNKHIVDAHIAWDIPVATISSFPSTITGYPPNITKTAMKRTLHESFYPPINPSGSRIVEAGALGLVADVLKVGIVPVLHGDVVLDRDQRCAILSGDHIIYW